MYSETLARRFALAAHIAIRHSLGVPAGYGETLKLVGVAAEAVKDEVSDEAETLARIEALEDHAAAMKAAQNP